MLCFLLWKKTLILYGHSRTFPKFWPIKFFPCFGNMLALFWNCQMLAPKTSSLFLQGDDRDIFFSEKKCFFFYTRYVKKNSSWGPLFFPLQINFFPQNFSIDKSYFYLHTIPLPKIYLGLFIWSQKLKTHQAAHYVRKEDIQAW